MTHLMTDLIPLAAMPTRRELRTSDGKPIRRANGRGEISMEMPLPRCITHPPRDDIDTRDPRTDKPYLWASWGG